MKPLMASATATFLFRQFFMTLPDELVEAARIDGVTNAFFPRYRTTVVKNHLAALFVITFIYGWNQHSWAAVNYYRRQFGHCGGRYQRHDCHR
jgi:sn-glycerol 3-phosphate transport system permease protein